MSGKCLSMIRELCVVLALWVSGTAAGQITKPSRSYVDWMVTTDHADRTYHQGEHPTVTVEAYAGGRPFEGTLFYRCGDEMLLPEGYQQATFHDGKATVDLGTMPQPGFRACDLYFVVEGKRYKELVKVAFDPTAIQSYTPMPKDFSRFWKQTLKAAERIPLEAKVTRMSKYDSDQSAVYLVELTVGAHGRKMFGYLSKPKDGKPHPVLLYPPGAGTRRIVPENIYSDQGLICLKIEIHGNNPELPDTEFNRKRDSLGSYIMMGIEQRDDFYYRDVYAGCCRCVDWLCTLPDWDGRNVVVTGGSQGGALTVITAALNPKVTALASFYPALCDLLGFRHQRAGGWPQYFRPNGSLSWPVTQADRIAAVLPYYDVVNFARTLTVPGFYNFGYADETCSPTSVWAMLNVITAPKTVEITPTSGHWRFIEVNDRSVSWLKHMTGQP